MAPVSAPKQNSKNKKIVFGAISGVVVIGLVVGAFFVGRTTAGSGVGDEDGGTVASLTSELEFVEADLEATRESLREAEERYYASAGQSVPAERSLGEQLRAVLDEAGMQGAGIADIESIENSPVAPFQTVTVNLGSAGYSSPFVALFWRNGTSGEWRLFGTMYRDFPCEQFVNLPQIFSGYRCQGEFNGVDHWTTVGEFWGVL